MPNEFDALFTEQASAAQGNEFDSLFDAQRLGPLDTKVQDAVGGNTEQAGQVLKSSRELQEPYALGKSEPAVTIQRARSRKAQAVMQGNPFLQDEVRDNPAFADVAADDFGALDLFSKAWNLNTTYNPLFALGRSIPAVAAGAQKGFAAEQQGIARLAQDKEGAKAYEDYIARLPQYQNGLPYYADLVGQVAGTLGFDALAGGIAGGVAGSAAPVVGTLLGATAGIATVNAQAAMGRFAMRLEAEEAKSGQKLDETVKFMAIAGLGAITAGTNFIGVKTGAGAAGALLEDAAAASLGQVTVQQALKRAAVETGKGGATGAALMGTMVAAEAILEDAAKELSPGDYETLLNDPARRAKVLGDVTQAMTDGFLLMGALHAVPAGRNLINDLKLKDAATQDKDILQAQMEAADGTALKARDPETFAAYAARHGDEELLVTGESAAELPEGLGRVMPDGAVAIPRADYLALVEMDLHRRIADDIVHGPNQVSVNTGKLIGDFASVSKRYASREQPPKAANDAGAVFDTWESRNEELQISNKTKQAELQAEYERASASNNTEELIRLGDEVSQLNNAIRAGEQSLFSRKQYELRALQKTLKAIEEGGGGLSERVLTERRTQVLKEIAEVEAQPDPISPLPDYKTGVKTTVDAFHGTNFNFIHGEGFSKEKLGTSTEAKSAEEAFFFARNPETSNNYVNPVGEKSTDSQQLIQARVTFNNPLVHDFKGTHFREETYYEVIKRAKKSSHDGVILLNTSDGGPTDVIYAAFDTKQIGHRLDNNARRAAEGGQKRLRQGTSADIIAANDLKGDNTPSKLNELAPPPALKPAIPTDPVVAEALANMDGMYLRPLFADAAAVGLTGEEFGRYNKLLEARAEAIRGRNERRIARDVTKRETPIYKEQQAKVLAEVEAEVTARPIMQAEVLLRSGDPALGKKATEFRLDSSLVDQVSRPGTAALLAGQVKRKGLHPDELASLVGYGSGPELVRDLVAMKFERGALTPAQYRKRVVDERVSALMEERYGVLKDNISAEAREAAIMPAATDILNAEREMLAAKAGMPIEATLGDMRIGVARDFAALRASDARKLPDYMRAVARAGRDAELSLLRGDFAKAFDAKQRQQISHLYAEQSKEFLRASKKVDILVKSYRDARGLPAVSQEFTDQIQRIIGALGEPLRRDGVELNEAIGTTSLDNFVAKWSGPDGGYPIPDIGLPLNEYGQLKPRTEWTVEDATQFGDLIQSLDAAGRNEMKVTVEGKKVALDLAVSEARKTILSRKEKFDPQERGRKADIKSWVRFFDASMVKMEQLIDWLDRDNPLGVLNTVIYRRLNEAKNFRQTLYDGLYEKIQDLGKDKEWIKNLNSDVPNDILMDPYVFKGETRPYKFTRKNLLAVMLNMGNEENFRKLHQGLGWDAAQVRQFVDRNATLKDWEFVQKVWDTFGFLVPHMEKTYKELVGIGPEQVRPSPIFTNFGRIEGGYFPLVNDPLRNAVDGEGNLIAKRDATTDIFGRAQFQPLPANGYTKKRTKVNYPLLLELDFIPTLLYRTAHDIAMRPALMDAKKVLLHPGIKDAVTRTFGKEYSDQFRPYLQAVASNGFRDMNGEGFLRDVLGAARQRSVGASIGLNIGTVLIHGGGAFTNSIGEVLMQHGYIAAAKATPRITSEFVRNGIAPIVDSMFRNQAAFSDMYKQVLAESDEIRNRHIDWERDIGNQMQKAIGERDWRKSWNHIATSAVGNFDLSSAVPTYAAAKKLYEASGMSEADAKYAAEKMVRKAHGSNSIVDQAAIQRGPEAIKAFTMYFGYFNHVYNRVRHLGQKSFETLSDVEKADYMKSAYDFSKIVAGSLFYILFPAVIHAIIRHPKEEEQSGLAWTGDALATQMLGMVPLIRGVPFALHTGQPFSLVPYQKEFNTVLDFGKDIHKAMFDTHEPKQLVKHGVGAAGIALNISGMGQVGRSAQFLWDTHSGRQHPEGFMEYYRGVMTGQARERKH